MRSAHCCRVFTIDFGSPYAATVFQPVHYSERRYAIEFTVRCTTVLSTSLHSAAMSEIVYTRRVRAVDYANYKYYRQLKAKMSL